MMWKIKIHNLVLSEDFAALPASVKSTILQVIQKKLSLDPEGYGKPLTDEFKGMWRVRVGDYRVVYRILKSEVLVLVIKVGIRRDDKIYQELLQRVRKVEKSL